MAKAVPDGAAFVVLGLEVKVKVVCPSKLLRLRSFTAKADHLGIGTLRQLIIK